jgi:hypothetical protein
MRIHGWALVLLAASGCGAPTTAAAAPGPGSMVPTAKVALLCRCLLPLGVTGGLVTFQRPGLGDQELTVRVTEVSAASEIEVARAAGTKERVDLDLSKLLGPDKQYLVTVINGHLQKGQPFPDPHDMPCEPSPSQCTCSGGGTPCPPPMYQAR